MSEQFFNPNAMVVPPEKVDFDRFNKIAKIAAAAVRRGVGDRLENAMLVDVLANISPAGPNHEPGELGYVFLDALAFRRSIGLSTEPGYVLRLAEFSIDEQLRRLYPDVYPDKANRDWLRDARPFSTLDLVDLQEEMSVNNLQSNMADAYAIYQILTSALHKRLGDQLSVLDTGASFALGLRKWLKDGFEPIRVFQELDPHTPVAPETLHPDHEMQALINDLARRAVNVERALGYDLVPVDPSDEKMRRRIFSHTFPMLESAYRPDEVKEFNALAQYHPENLVIAHHNIDARSPEDLERLRAYLPDGRANVGIFSAVLFENTPEVAAEIIENVKPYVSDFLFITDFARPDKSQPGGLKFIRRDWWHHPGSFGLFTIDLKNPNQTYPIEIARFMTRRGKEMWLTEAGRHLLLSGELPA